MLHPTEMAERHGRVLAELAELGLSAARRMHEQVMAAETPQDAREATLALHRISRSVRQAVALEAKLERDRARQEREDRADAVREGEALVEKRKVQVRGAIERIVIDEDETLNAVRRLEDLDWRLDADAVQDAFLRDPIEVVIARLSAEIGIRPAPDAAHAADPARWRAADGDAPRPPSSPELSPAQDRPADAEAWRSSA